MKYTSTLGEKICQQTIDSCVGLRHICKGLNMPYSTVTSWIYDENHELHNWYANAKQLQIDRLTEEVLQIADDSSKDYLTVVARNGSSTRVFNRVAISRSRIRIQARQFIIATLAPVPKIRRRNKLPEFYFDALREDYEDPLSQGHEHATAQGQNALAKQENRAAEKTPSSSPKNALKLLPGASHSVDPLTQKVDKNAPMILETRSIPLSQGSHQYQRQSTAG